MKRQFSGIMTLLIVLISLQAVYAQTETTITECDYQHVAKAITTGGSIVLDCDRNIQIWANKPLTITADTSIKPAAGRKISLQALKGRAFVVNKGVTLTLEAITLKGNDNELGGGIANEGTLIVTNGIFDNNDGAPGAAIYNNDGGTATISNSLFSNNETFGGGGAIYNAAKAEMTINDSTFTKNQSLSNSGGGAIYNVGKMSITGSTFTQNNSQGRFGWGGAIWNSGEGVISVVNSTFALNTAGHSGAAIRNDIQGQTTIQFSTFVSNSTEVWGGALYIEGGTITVSNSLFSQNTANTIANDCDNQVKMGEIKTTNNLSNAGCGDKAAAGVASLSNNGGLTQTVAIASDSNAVDAASECPASDVDQRGTARPQGKACDIGAYEFVELTTAATSVSLCQVTTTRDVRLRTEPNTASSVLAVVPHALTFQAIEQVTGWYHITYGAVDGWLSADFVTTKGACSG
jgi:uncharacterized protein YgiM (DUF1202 family)